MDDIVIRLQDIFREVFDDEKIEIFDEMTAADVEEWDSLSHIQLIVAIESAFGIKFRTADIIGLKNVGEFIALLKKYIKEKEEKR